MIYQNKCSFQKLALYFYHSISYKTFPVSGSLIFSYIVLLEQSGIIASGHTDSAFLDEPFVPELQAG